MCPLEKDSPARPMIDDDASAAGDADEQDMNNLDEGDVAEILVLESQNNSHRLSNDNEDEANAGSDSTGSSSSDIAPSQQNSEIAATMESDGDAIVDDMQDDAVMVLKKHTSDVLCVASSPTDPNLLVSGGQDDVGILWNIEDGIDVGEVDGSGESVSTVAFSVDGEYVAFGSENGAIAVVVLLRSSEPRKPLDGPGDAIQYLSWHPRGPILLAGSADNVSYMWNVAKSTFMLAFVGHEAAVTAGGFSADGKLVVTSSFDMSLRVWNPTNGQTIRRVQNGLASTGALFHTDNLLSLTLGPIETPCAKLAATGCVSGDVFVTQIESGAVVARLCRHEGGTESLAFSPPVLRPVLLATAGADGKIRIWDAEAGSERFVLEHAGVIVKVTWHPSLPLLASASAEGTLAVWHGLSGKQLAFFTGHTDFITDVCFAADNQALASSAADRSLRIYDLRPVIASL